MPPPSASTRSRPANAAAAAPRRLDAPLLVLAVTAVAYAAFIVAALARHDYDPSFFIQAGDRHADPNVVPQNLRVLRSSAGYDGQFYYRLALNPFTTKRTELGVTLDNPGYRQQRIMYPLVVWLLTGGNPELVPAALILVNYLAVCAIGYIGALYARALHEHALWGLMFSLYPGFLYVIVRDLTELLAACLLLASLLLVRHRRHVFATVLLVMAVLARESSLLVALAGLLVSLAGAWTGKNRAALRWHTWVVPIAVYGAWQLLLAYQWGHIPVGGTGAFGRASQLGTFGPQVFAAFFLEAGQLATYVHRIRFAEACFLLAFAISVASALRSTGAYAHEQVAWLLSVGLALAFKGWFTGTQIRSFAEFYCVGAIILVGSRSRGRAPVLACALVLWLVVFRHFAVGYG
jgi:hypothetical protein